MYLHLIWQKELCASGAFVLSQILFLVKYTNNQIL